MRVLWLCTGLVVAMSACNGSSSPVNLARELVSRDAALKERFERGGGWRRQGARIEAYGSIAGVTANTPVEIGVAKNTGLRVSLSLQGARPSTAEIAEGKVAYHDVARSTDLLWTAEPTRVEAFFVLRDASAPREFVWDVTYEDGIRQVRARDSRIEFLDEAGDARIAVSNAYAVDARGTRRAATLSWKDAHLGVKLDTDGLSYPILLDPAFETPVWRQLPSSGWLPSERYSYSIAYDSARSRVVMFGGATTASLPQGLDELLEFDGSTWTQIPKAGNWPGRSNNIRLVYDSNRGVSVLIWSDCCGSTPGTWEWNGTSWTGPIAPGATPTGAGGVFVGATFDPVANRVLAFRSGTLWSYDGASWSAIAPAGSGPPTSASLAYDSFRGVTVAHPLTTGDTWEWNGSTWLQRSVGGPASGQLLVTAYDPIRRVVMGMTNIGGDRLYEYDGVTWIDRGLWPGDTRTSFDIVATNFAGQGGALVAGGRVGSTAQRDVWTYRTRGGACTVGTQCNSGQCVDGVCCENAACGTCQRCDGTSPGVCSAVTNAQDPDSCTGALSCGPSGLCGVVNGTGCTANNQCQSGACVDGVCCNTACSGTCRACNAATLGWASGVNGVCTNAPTGNADPLCAPFVCGAGGVCANTCTTDANCQAGQYCNASSQCVAKKIVGATCNTAATTGDCRVTGCGVCASGQCVDGVCCATACAGACKSCAVPGSQGTCTNSTEGFVDPHGICTVQSATTCGFSGTCDGAGACARYPQGTSCVAAACPSSTSQSSPRICDGFGTCDVATTSSCGAYACASGACKTTCTGVGDCAPGNTCLNGVCSGPVGCATSCTLDSQCCVGLRCAGGICTAGGVQGSACSEDNQCASGHCTNGYCCDASCSTGCTVCNGADLGKPGAVNGTCTAAPAGAPAEGCNGALCDGTSLLCPGTCANDNDCATTHYCATSNVCAPRKTQGLACNTTSDCKVAGCRVCETDHCVDGVCCDSDCTGNACNACNVAGSVGECAPRPLGAICEDAMCTSATTIATARVCDGASTCLATENHLCAGPCSNGVCGMGTGCAASCSDDSGCCQNDRCVAGACRSGVAPMVTSTANLAAFAFEPYHYDEANNDRVAASGASPLSFSLLPNSFGASIDAATGKLLWTPNASGTSQLIVAVNNPWGTATQTIDVVVDAPRPPVIAEDGPTAAAFTVPYSHQLTATGARPMTFTLVSGPAGMSVTSGGLIAWTPSQSGMTTVTIAADSAFGSDEYVYDINVTAGLPPTIIENAAASGSYGVLYSYQLQATGATPLSYARVSGPTGLAVSSDGLITWTPMQVGAFPVTVQATNTFGSDVYTYSLVINADGQPPIITHNAPTTAVVTMPYTFQLDAIGEATITYALVAGPTGMTVSTSGLISWSPSVIGATNPVTVQATNARGTDVYTYNIEVIAQPVSAAPRAVARTSDGLVRGDATFLAQLDGTDSTGEITDYQWTFGDGSPPERGVTLMHPYRAPGGYVARLRVSDALARVDVDALGLQVSDGTGLYPPVVEIVVDKTVGPASLSVNFRCECTLAPGARLLWLFGDGADSTESYPNHVYATPGTYEVSLYGFDPTSGLTGFDRVQVKAAAGDKLPPSAFAYANPSTGNLTGTTTQIVVNFSAEASDDDGAIVSYRWTMNDVEESRSPTFVKTFDRAGNYTMKLEVTDSDNLVATSQVEVQVLKDGASPPKFLSTPVVATKAGEPYIYEASVRGTRALSFALSEDSPRGMRVDAQTGKVTWTPTNDDAGKRSITLRVENAAGADEQRYDLEVASDGKPSGGCSATGGAQPTRREQYALLGVLLLGAAIRLRSARRPSERATAQQV